MKFKFHQLLMISFLPTLIFLMLLCISCSPGEGKKLIPSQQRIFRYYLGEKTIYEMQWEKTLGGKKAEHGESIIQTFDGGYAICGQTWSKGAGVSDAWIVKLNSILQVQWERTFGGPEYDHASIIIQTKDGGYAICGVSHYPTRIPEYRYGSWINKLDKNGVLKWERKIDSVDEIQAITQTTSGDYKAIGKIEGDRFAVILLIRLSHKNNI